MTVCAQARAGGGGRASMGAWLRGSKSLEESMYDQLDSSQITMSHWLNLFVICAATPSPCHAIHWANR